VREPIVIRNVAPELDCGRYPVKREIGDWLLVEADIFRDGHDRLSAALCFRGPGESPWQDVPLTPGVNDRWSGSFPLDRIGLWHYTIEAWTDRWGSWVADVTKKVDAGQDVVLDLAEGRALVRHALERAGEEADRRVLREAETNFGVRALADERLSAVMRRYADRGKAARYRHVLPLRVDRERARFAAWYEFFPRSQSPDPTRHGTFADAQRRVAQIAELGFDVVYLPPIHPIGQAFRKGRNNALSALPGDVGSPYAIGNAEGGHTAIHPQLGTLDDFRRFVETANACGMEVALDYALQASPDHPWVKEHPEWFSFRADGSIRYAENPPKKYQDIVNFNFDSPNAHALWEALRDVVLFWIDQGVKTFRVDNPHTKPFPFWEWLIGEVQTRHPETIFLAEAFTRPKVMWELARLGFTQSYTYFTWRNDKRELTDYMIELATQTNEFLRPNFFANTPDILSRFLQEGGRPAFRIRLVLAATLSSLYGIYSGFELVERDALPNSEEYRDSEKYELRVRDWNAEGNIVEDVRAINAIRRRNPALREFENIRFYPSNDDAVIFYGKVDFFHRNHVFVAVNLDPHNVRTALLEFPTGEFGMDPFAIVDELKTTQLNWEYGHARVVLDPISNPAAVFVFNR
jgi:starch synthase (maltosyl-transferring)